MAGSTRSFLLLALALTLSMAIDNHIAMTQQCLLLDCLLIYFTCKWKPWVGGSDDLPTEIVAPWRREQADAFEALGSSSEKQGTMREGRTGSRLTLLEPKILDQGCDEGGYEDNKKIIPRVATDVKLICSGKILENNRTVAQCRSPFDEIPGGFITMHVVVQPSSSKVKTEKKVEELSKTTTCLCTIL